MDNNMNGIPLHYEHTQYWDQQIFDIAISGFLEKTCTVLPETIRHRYKCHQSYRTRRFRRTLAS